MRMTRTLAALVAGIMLTAAAHGAETYTVDPVHSYVGFAVTHLMVSTVQGRFKDVSGTIQYDDKNVENSSVEVAIKTASLNTETEKRDTHLRSPDFFDVEKYPEITFKSTKIEKKGDGFVATGKLTIRGVTKEVQIPFKMRGPAAIGKGKRLGVTGTLTINRQDYGVSWNKTIDGGGVVVSDDVDIDLKVEAGNEPKS
jgi:polyisoprenoid-binding protein YceI